MAKWLKHSIVDQRSQVWIPPVSSQVKCFLYPSSPLETTIWLKGPGGKNKHLCLSCIALNIKRSNINFLLWLYFTVIKLAIAFAIWAASYQHCFLTLYLTVIKLVIAFVIWVASYTNIVSWDGSYSTKLLQYIPWGSCNNWSCQLATRTLLDDLWGLHSGQFKLFLRLNFMSNNVI